MAADDGFDVLITTGAYLDLSDTATPAHVHIERFVPGSAALRRAIAAIHCGGNGTTYQVLGSGRPAVVLPFTNDQRINAWLIARHGLGLALDPDRTGPAELRAALHGVRRDPTVRTKMERFQTLVGQADGPGRAAAEIIELGDPVEGRCVPVELADLPVPGDLAMPTVPAAAAIVGPGWCWL